LDRALGLADEVGGPAQDALAGPVPSADPSPPRIRPRPDTSRPLSHADSSTDATPPTAEAAAEPSLFPYVLPPPTMPHRLLRLGRSSPSRRFPSDTQRPEPANTFCMHPVPLLTNDMPPPHVCRRRIYHPRRHLRAACTPRRDRSPPTSKPWGVEG